MIPALSNKKLSIPQSDGLADARRFLYGEGDLQRLARLARGGHRAPAVARILKQPDMPKRLRVFDLAPAHSTPEAFSQRIAREIAMWSKVVKAGNIKAE